MEFRTQYDAHERVHTEPGCPIKIIYGLKVQKDGKMELEEKGKENLYEFIQSFADSVDINVLLKRYQNGDLTALGSPGGSFGDFSDAPTSLIDMYDTVLRGEEYFNSLPVEVRANFNHNFGEFAASLSDPDIMTKLGQVPDQTEEQKLEAVKDVVTPVVE